MHDLGAGNSVLGLRIKLPKALSWAWRLKMELDKIAELANIVSFDPLKYLIENQSIWTGVDSENKRYWHKHSWNWPDLVHFMYTLSTILYNFYTIYFRLQLRKS